MFVAERYLPLDGARCIAHEDGTMERHLEGVIALRKYMPLKKQWIFYQDAVRLCDGIRLGGRNEQLR